MALPLGFFMLILGYALAYSGISQISTGGSGWGFMQALGVKGTHDIGFNAKAFTDSITNPSSGAATTSASPTAAGTQQI